MYLHKDNRELFKDMVTLVSERLGVTTDIVEKDYYVTMICVCYRQLNIPLFLRVEHLYPKPMGS